MEVWDTEDFESRFGSGNRERVSCHGFDLGVRKWVSYAMEKEICEWWLLLMGGYKFAGRKAIRTLSEASGCGS